MISRSTSIIALAAILVGAPILFASCASAPKPAPAEPAPAAPAPEPPKPDLAALIGAKDTAGIKQFFGNRDLLDQADKDGLYPLHRAVQQNASDIIEILLIMGSKADQAGPGGKTPLRMAVDGGFVASAKVLAERGADLFSKDSSGGTVASAAIAKGGDLLAAVFGAKNVNSKADDGTTALHLAADGLYEDAVRKLLAAGADPSLKNLAGRTALDLALLHPDRIEAARIAESIIVRGVSPSFPDFAWFAQAARAVDYGSVRFDEGNAPLHEAVIRKQRGFVEFLLSRKSSPNVKNGSGSAPLHEAVRAGWLDGAELLLKNSADPNARDGFDNTPLHIALPESGRTEGVTLLLKYGADPSLKDRNGNIPLHIAVQVGYPVALVEKLLAAGSSVNASNAAGDTPLIATIRSGKFEYAAPLLAKGADIFLVNGHGESALSLAINTGGASGSSAVASASGVNSGAASTAALGAIITKATVGIRDNLGNTPLAVATILKASAEALGLIIARSGDPNARNNAGDAPLHIAVRNNQRIQGEALLGAKADIFAANVKGETPLTIALGAKGGPIDWLFNPTTISSKDANGDGPLHHAARRDLSTALEFLGQKGADPAARNSAWETPLAVAIKADAAESVRVLAAMGSPLGARDAMGDTALHAAVLWSARKCLPLLILSGADIDARNFAGETPLHLAVKKRDSDSLRYLIDRGASPTARDNRGITALALAARAGATDLAGFLLAAGADPNERDLSGRTTLRLAVEATDIEMIRLLAGAGGDLFAQDAEGFSPIAAAAARSLPALEALIVPQAVNRSDPEGRSLLRASLDARPSLEIAELFIAKGTNIDVRDRFGATPLHALLRVKELGVASRLAEAGSDLFAKDKEGESPISMAVAAGPETLKALLGTTRIGAQDYLGNTPLHYAALAGSASAIEWLIAAGADRGARTIAGETAAEVAAKRGFADLATKLQ